MDKRPRLPEVTKSPILHVDMTPDDDLPVRILKAYLQNCDTRWVVEGLGKSVTRVYDAMNEAQGKRAEILKRAITSLETGKRRRE